MPRNLKPSEVAALLGISTRQLRKPFFDRFSGMRRTKGNQRRYRDTKAFRSEVAAFRDARLRRVIDKKEAAENRRAKSDFRWAEGDRVAAWMLARQASGKWRSETRLIGIYSKSSGRSRNWITEVLKVALAYGPSERHQGLLWTHHRIAMKLPNRAALLRSAAKRKLGPRKFRDEIFQT